jgi:methionine salvage enolase-phosphatase E1
MKYAEKLAIARLSYKDIKEVVDKWQASNLEIYAYWDGKIEVDGEMFQEYQLRDPEE